MTDIGLDRAYQQRIGAVSMSGNGAADGARLLRITGRRARAVGFQVRNAAGIDACLPVNVAQQRFLGRRAGKRHAVGVTVRVDAGTEDDRVNRIAVSLCSCQRFEK